MGTVPFFRGAFTLIEMLIVISILMILAGAAANVMRPALDGRRIREAARAVNVYLSSARNRAMETGRPCGVILRRFNNTAAVMNLDQCEVPACYSGELESSTATVSSNGSTVTANLGAAPPAGVVNSGDLIQFNYQGPLYKIDSPGATITASLYSSQDQAIPWTGQSVPYRIFRSPSKASVMSLQAQPLQLPAASIVDLNASSIDGTPPLLFSTSTTADVMITFAPNGSVDRVYINNSPVLVSQPIFLLIGKNENLGSNEQDVTNFWVAINPQTGLVTTDMVAAGSDPRQFIRDAQGMGGK
jgi:prepilin-type N-terminal cleavage/methylation domain-containing protein